MQEVTTYAGCFVPVTQSEGERITVKGKSVNDTHMVYDGKAEHFRLIPRKLMAYCNTYTKVEAGGSLSFWFRASAMLLIATAEQQQCRVKVKIGGREFEAQAHPGVFLRCEQLSGEQEFSLTVLEGSLLIDRAVLEGRGAAVTYIDGANQGYVITSPGCKKNGHFTEMGSGENAEIYCMGSRAALTLDGMGRVCVRCGESERYLNIDCKRTVHVQLPDPERFNRIRLEVCSGNIVLCGLKLSDTTEVISVMNRRTDEELDAMSKGTRTFLPPEQWKPVKLMTVPLKGVILGKGVLKDRFERNITYLKKSLELPRWVDAKDDDRIWIDMLVASNEGRMLVGMSNTLRYKEVPAFRKAVKEMLDEVERRQFTNNNGYCLPYESSLFALSKDTWPGIMRDEIKNYDRTMFTKGLLAAGYAGFDEAWGIVRAFYDWYNNCEYLPVMLLGSMGIQGSAAGPRVYQSPVGRPEDIITNMKYYDMDWWLEFLAQDIPEAVWRFTLNRPHNYLLTSVCALFDIYAATGDARYRDAALGAYRIYRDYFMLPGSFITICEHFECRPGTHKISNIPNSIFETCAGVFWTELSQRLLSADPDNEEYALQMEQSIFNLTCSCQGPEGKVRYFNHLNGYKYPDLRYNTCCEIQATGFIGQIQQFIYMLDDAGVQVNLFAESEINFNVGGSEFVLEQHTSFPYGDTVRFRVRGEGEFRLRVRVPSWSRSASLTVCGQSVQCSAGQYACIEREWHTGDEVVLKTSRSISCVKYTGENRTEYPRYAVMYGPIMMCVVGEGEHCVQHEAGTVAALALGQDEHGGAAERTALLPFGHEELEGRLVKQGRMEYAISGTDFRLIPYFSFDDGREFTCFPAFKE
ncbi:MAG: glycoside hydrolase family 127 protein [Firmicutes bacterium]|nr:glycoside hydrolase family 127 protein [Bacillota bacterium]